MVNGETLKVEWCSQEGGKRSLLSTHRTLNERAPAQSTRSRTSGEQKQRGRAGCRFLILSTTTACPLP